MAVGSKFGNLLCTPATLEPIKDWSLNSPKKMVINIGSTCAKFVSHGRHVAFKMVKVGISGTSSLASSGSSPNCGHCLMLRRREAGGCHALQPKPRETYALMKVKSTFPAHNAQAHRFGQSLTQFAGVWSCNGSQFAQSSVSTGRSSGGCRLRS